MANPEAAASRLEAELRLALGEQKIDVVRIDSTTAQVALHLSARRNAIPL